MSWDILISNNHHELTLALKYLVQHTTNWVWKPSMQKSIMKKITFIHSIYFFKNILNYVSGRLKCIFYVCVVGRHVSLDCQREGIAIIHAAIEWIIQALHPYTLSIHV